MTLYEKTPKADDDAPVHVSPVTPSEDARTVLINSLSWGAVFAGVAASLVAQLLLNMLGLGIGLTTVDPWTGDTPSAEGMSISAGIWWVASGVIASLLGGMLAGRLSGRPKESTAGWHGVTAWAVATLVVALFIGSILAGVIGGAVSAAGNAVGGLGNAAAQIATPTALERLQQEISDTTAGTNDPAALQGAAVSAVTAMFTASDEERPAARDRAATALSRALGIPVEEAQARLDELQARYEQVQTEATRTAEEAAEVGAQIAIYSFIALLLGGLAAWFGGRWGMVRPTVTADAVAVRTAPRR